MKPLALYFFCLWAALSIVAQDALAAPCAVQVNAQDLVSFNAGTGGTALTQILTQLAQKAGVQIFLPDKIPAKSMAASFKTVSIEDAVARLLGDNSFAVIYPQETGSAGLLYFDTLDVSQNAVAGSITGAPKGRVPARHSVKASGTNGQQSIRQSVYGQSSQSHTLNTPVGQNIRRGNDGNSSITSKKADSDTGLAAGQQASSSTSSSVAASSATASNAGDSNADSEGLLADNSGTDQSSTDVSDSDTTKQEITRLKYQIEKLNDDIDSGRATQFWEKWTAIKDESYVYSHWDDLAAKQKRLAELEEN